MLIDSSAENEALNFFETLPRQLKDQNSVHLWLWPEPYTKIDYNQVIVWHTIPPKAEKVWIRTFVEHMMLGETLKMVWMPSALCECWVRVRIKYTDWKLCDFQEEALAEEGVGFLLPAEVLEKFQALNNTWHILTP